MPVYVCVTGDSPVRLWGLTGRERLERAFAAMDGVEAVAGPEAVPAETTAVALRADHAYDGAVLRGLVEGAEPVCLLGEDGTPVAARGSGGEMAALLEALAAADAGGLADRPSRSAGELASGFRSRLRSVTPPRVSRITADNRRALEGWLFSGAYKGVTDLITKWLWPVPAQWAVHGCIRLGLSPNAVTTASLVLAIAALVAFAGGAYGLGLVAGWLMTFLDTVDGKLARVTLTSSRFGDYLDHGIDLIHPPFWYLAWGLGLAAPWTLTPSLGVTVTAIFAAYIGGRLCEGAFQWFAAPFSLFIWRPFDSFNRLITARRNPNLILLTAFWLGGRPDLGLWMVAAWHVLSTLVLAARVVQAALRARGAALVPWLNDVDPARDRDRLAVRCFTQAPAGGAGARR
ncbi:CDP-alcohol phosphatidyltransferase family protein [Arhodomonas aquaeolei]|uniref:CDP-alcohol phosphatidyltransferase family protein n=1 Tax=Arhodomonas aquaeolei TaxID=2369 RepID=UPI002168FA7A|nr:CDP-alcohol phosphatidyltransferase family protein [Arhodomonas aquaeolei]MCS4503113.1 CDP-alcohol phosphatidyltransferase family protein [Arhodomonas aquaeolei]